VERPTHTNTSWDVARFETCAHRWVHVGEEGFGAAVANDAMYGHDITRHAREGGGTYSLVRQTLVRAPLFPDPDADQGAHVFRTSLVVGDVADAVEEGYRLNLVPRDAPAAACDPLVTGDAGVVVETVKLADDRSGDVVVRAYEPLGRRRTASLRFGFPVGSVVETDVLENPVEATAVTASTDTQVSVALRPFQLVTLRLRRRQD